MLSLTGLDGGLAHLLLLRSQHELLPPLVDDQAVPLLHVVPGLVINPDRISVMHADK